MPRPVYSRPFIREKGVRGDSELVIVPAGYFYVVRAIAVYCSVGLVDNVAVLFKHASIDSVLWMEVWTPEARKSAYLDCHFAFATTESFKFQVESGGARADVFCGGYQLLAN
jgi:hypothetical protein